jgi:hypothetical protein
MRPSRRNLVRWGLVTVLGMVSLAAPAFGQRRDEEEGDKKTFREPGVEYLEEKSQYIQWLFGALMIAACLFIGLKNPHRTHLD